VSHGVKLLSGQQDKSGNISLREPRNQTVVVIPTIAALRAASDILNKPLIPHKGPSALLLRR
jgi:hypothetical protein